MMSRLVSLAWMVIVALLIACPAGAQRGSRAECAEIGWTVVTTPGGGQVCVPPVCASKKRTKNSVPGCDGFPISPGGSVDPNDKVGSLGVTGSRFLSGGEPLRYAILFENLATATLPAQKVVVTDQLDPTKVDLDSVSLGPIVFGIHAASPPPGLSQFTTDVDLRPAQNLIVRIDARLDKSTGVLAWQFLSIDPATGTATTDPSAGFLPPNANPPAGEGSVLFTARPKPALATGTQVTNQASIVFDANVPIATPVWSNAIDTAKPVSQVLALAPTQSSPTFTVRWSGDDAGAGIFDYSVFVSENGGAFAPLVTATADTSTSFTGRSGSSYAFFSVARDLAGNVEDKVPAAEAATTVARAGSAQLTTLGPATAWIGLRNSDDVGTTLDLTAQVSRDGTVIGSGHVNGVPAGSSGFHNARLDSMSLSLAAPVDAGSGTTLGITIAARISCSRRGHRSGTARLWFGDRGAGSDFSATIGGVATSYYLVGHSGLSTTAGTGPRSSRDAVLDSRIACPGRPFTPFGTWSITLP